MKNFFACFLLPLVCASMPGYAADGDDVVVQPVQGASSLVQKHSSSSHHRGPRGHRGLRGHRGPRGHRGKPGTGSTIFDRAYLVSPNVEEPFVIDPEGSPVVIPVDQTDLGSSFFDSSTHAFTVPEDGIYQISYFLKATAAIGYSLNQPLADRSGLVMAIIVDENFSNPIGIRSLPLVDASVPSYISVVWGTHHIFARLSQGQTIQLVALALPLVQSEGDYPVAMQFVQTGDVSDEVSYLSIRKVGS